jgi:hypothetical protein
MAAFDDNFLVNLSIHDDLSSIKNLIERLEGDEDGRLQNALGEQGLCERLKSYLETSDIGVKAFEKIIYAMVLLCRRTMDKATSCPENCKRFHSAGSFETILKSVSTFCLLSEEDTSKAVSEYGAKWALWFIAVTASDNEDRQKSWAEAVPLLIKVLETHGKSAEVAEMGCRAARNISMEEENASALVSEGIAECINKLMKTHRGNGAVSESIAWALVNLSCSENIATILGAHGCCVIVADALVECLTSTTTATSSSSSSEGAEDKNGMETLMNARTSLQNDDGSKLAFVSALCWAVRNLAASSAFNHAIFNSTYICETMVFLLTFCTEELQSISNITVANQGILLDILEGTLYSIANLACEPRLALRLCTAQPSLKLSPPRVTHLDEEIDEATSDKEGNAQEKESTEKPFDETQPAASTESAEEKVEEGQGSETSVSAGPTAQCIVKTFGTHLQLVRKLGEANMRKEEQNIILSAQTVDMLQNQMPSSSVNISEAAVWALRNLASGDLRCQKIVVASGCAPLMLEVCILPHSFCSECSALIFSSSILRLVSLFCVSARLSVF